MSDALADRVERLIYSGPSKESDYTWTALGFGLILWHPKSSSEQEFYRAVRVLEGLHKMIVAAQR